MKSDENTQKALKAFENFLEVIKRLRAPDGCPWDKEQTPLSMRFPLIEETFEAVDAISQNDAEHAKEELGDVFLNTLMISYMYEQNGDFKIYEEIDELTKKLIRRHPHVFAESEGKICETKKVSDSKEVLEQWDKIKSELEGRNKNKTILDEIPKGFPQLLKAFKYQKKAAKLGFDWDTTKQTLEKMFEELNEVEEAKNEVEKNSKDGQKPFEKSATPELNSAKLHLEEEIGDLMFAVINYARKANVDIESALERTNKKFYRRFSYVEQKMKENNIPQDHAHLKEQDDFWNEAKKLGM